MIVKRTDDLKVADLECGNLFIFCQLSLCNTFSTLMSILWKTQKYLVSKPKKCF